MFYGRPHKFALRALIRLQAAGDEPVRLADFQREYNVNPSGMAVQLRKMSRRGWVEAVRGRGGGYRLKTPLASIRVVDFFEAFESKGKRKKVVVTAHQKRFNKNLRRVLGDKTLADFL